MKKKKNSKKRKNNQRKNNQDRIKKRMSKEVKSFKMRLMAELTGLNQVLYSLMNFLMPFRSISSNIKERINGQNVLFTLIMLENYSSAMILMWMMVAHFSKA